MPFLTSGADDAGARIAPDGGSVAYLSSDSGRHEVHLTSFPARGASTRVSSGGARLPRWSSDGRQLFYIATDGQLMTVPVHTSGALQVGRPLPVPGFSGAQRWAFFEVLPDGQFVAIISEASGGEQPLTVVLNRPFGPAQP